MGATPAERRSRCRGPGGRACVRRWPRSTTRWQSTRWALWRLLRGGSPALPSSPRGAPAEGGAVTRRDVEPTGLVHRKPPRCPMPEPRPASRRRSALSRGGRVDADHPAVIDPAVAVAARRRGRRPSCVELKHHAAGGGGVEARPSDRRGSDVGGVTRALSPRGDIQRVEPELQRPLVGEGHRVEGAGRRVDDAGADHADGADVAALLPRLGNRRAQGGAPELDARRGVERVRGSCSAWRRKSTVVASATDGEPGR